jgi:hypothetical protein
MKTKWINVKDRLPDESNNVLVFNGNFIAIGYYRKDFKINDNNSILAIPRKWEYANVILDWDITHWMPLPEPPTD